MRFMMKAFAAACFASSKSAPLPSAENDPNWWLLTSAIQRKMYLSRHQLTLQLWGRTRQWAYMSASSCAALAIHWESISVCLFLRKLFLRTQFSSPSSIENKNFLSMYGDEKPKHGSNLSGCNQRLKFWIEWNLALSRFRWTFCGFEKKIGFSQ